MAIFNSYVCLPEGILNSDMHITLEARKGVNVPDCEIDCAALTTKALGLGWYPMIHQIYGGTWHIFLMMYVLKMWFSMGWLL